jgi:hypothetical protein
MLHHNPSGRPTKDCISGATKLQYDKCLHEKIQELRIGHGTSTKMVLLLSFSTDNMIREMQKYPEVFFMDVTGRANKQKRSLFVLVGRKPNGNTFIANVTLVPSGKDHSYYFIMRVQWMYNHYILSIGQAWVYRLVSRYIWPVHFGSVTISRNRLGLTDEERAEYETFERNIALDPNYRNSKLMLCAFHAIWMPFRQTVRPTLPKSSGGNLSKIGREYGECFELIN